MNYLLSWIVHCYNDLQNLIIAIQALRCTKCSSLLFFVLFTKVSSSFTCIASCFHPSTCPSTHPFIRQPIHPTIHPTAINLLIHPFIRTSIGKPIHQYIHPSTDPYFHLSILPPNPSIQHSIHQHIYAPTHPFNNPFNPSGLPPILPSSQPSILSLMCTGICACACTHSGIITAQAPPSRSDSATASVIPNYRATIQLLFHHNE